MNLNYESARFYLEVIQFAGTILLGVYVWWTNREKVTAARFRLVEERVAKVEMHVERPQVCGSHGRMESNDRDINARLSGIEAGLNKIDGRLEGINRMVDLLTQNELNNGGK